MEKSVEIDKKTKNKLFGSIKNDGGGKYSGLYDWADSIAISVFCIILIFTFFFRMVGVKGESMMNTLQNGDHVVITNFFYTPHYGDIVVVSRAYIKDENGNSVEPIIKRVIATEGQTIDIRNGSDGKEVFVDGKKLDEPYIKEAMMDYYEPTVKFPYTISAGHVFVMGDNRNNSRDSRSETVHELDVRYILGRAMLRIYPFKLLEEPETAQQEASK